jgi:hypothetical protein
MLALLFPTVALASSVTELPPMLRGDVSIGYAWESLRGSLQETGADGQVEVGQRVLTEHVLRYRADFTAGPGVGVFVEVPQWASQSVTGTEGQTMVYDPATRTGTLIGTNPVADGDYASGSGVGGVWLGVRGTPWSESFRSRNNVTWLLEGAVRTPDASNFWAGKDRGAGPGGLGWRLHSAFSHTRGDSSPYLAVTWTQNRALEADTFAADGTPLATGVAVDPADTLRLRIGTENLASREAASGSELRFDLHATVDYAGPSTVPSGVFLPSVLDATEGAAVQQAEQLRAGAGLGVHWRPMTYVELRLFADAATQLPQRLEHPYPVRTGFDTLAATAGTELRVRIR